jgi:hypothetical protein
VTEDDKFSAEAVVIFYALLESLNRSVSLRELVVNLSRGGDVIHDLSSAALKAAPEEATADSSRDAKTAADCDAAVPEEYDPPCEHQDYADESRNREQVSLRV